MKMLRWSLAMVALGMFFAAPLYAEKIVLKTGQALDRKITERTDKYIKVDVVGVPVTYYLDKIETIDGQPVMAQTAQQLTTEQGQSVPAGNAPQDDKIKQSMQLALEANDAVAQNDPAKAFSLLEQSLGLDPQNYVALTELAGLYSQFKNDLAKSNELLNQALAIRDFDMAHFGLAMNLAAAGKFDEAKAEFQKTLAMTDQDYVKKAVQEMLAKIEKIKSKPAVPAAPVIPAVPKK